MTVIANPIETNLLKAVKCAHLSRAFIIFFYLFGFRQVLLFLGSPIAGLLQIFFFSFCPEPLTYFIKCALWQFKCKTKLMKALDGRSCLTARLHSSGEDAHVSTDNREEAHREWESRKFCFWSQCSKNNNNNNLGEAHRLSVVPSPSLTCLQEDLKPIMALTWTSPALSILKQSRWQTHLIFNAN